jgi:hypothetical protein
MQANESFTRIKFKKAYRKKFKQQMYKIEVIKGAHADLQSSTSSHVRWLFLTELGLLNKLHQCFIKARSNVDSVRASGEERDCKLDTGVYHIYEEMGHRGVPVEDLIKAFEADL